MSGQKSQPVFVRLKSMKPRPQYHYFVGITLDAILKDTNGGTEWRGRPLISQEEVNEAVVEELGFDLLREGIEALERGCSSHFLVSCLV